MSGPRNIRGFTDKWLYAFDWFEQNPEQPFTIHAGTLKRAQSVRFSFYGVRSAMQRDEGLRLMYPNAVRREAVIEGTDVVFRFKETTPIALLLEESLKENSRGDGDDTGGRKSKIRKRNAD